MEMFIILLLVLLTSLLKSWRILVPPTCPAKNGHFITNYPKRFAFQAVSFCVTGEVQRDRGLSFISCVCQHTLSPWRTLQLIDWFAKVQAGCLKRAELQRKAFPGARITFNQLWWPPSRIPEETIKCGPNNVKQRVSSWTTKTEEREPCKECPSGQEESVWDYVQLATSSEYVIKSWSPRKSEAPKKQKPRISSVFGQYSRPKHACPTFSDASHKEFHHRVTYPGRTKCGCERHSIFTV